MRTKSKLYTVNKWNKPSFMPKEENLFAGPQLGPSQMQRLKLQNMSTNPGGFTPSLPKGGMGSLSASNPTEFFGLGTTGDAGAAAKGAGLKGFLEGAGGAALSAGSGIIGSLAGNAISGGLESSAGSAISNIGGQLGSAIGAVNPVAGAIVGVGSQLLGGLTNRAFGSKLNEEKIAEVQQQNAKLNQAANTLAGSSGKEGLLSGWNDVDTNYSFNQEDIGEDGWFSDKAEKKYEELKRAADFAKQNALLGFRTGLHNVETDEDAAVASNFIYALGGDLQTNGADFGNGLVFINKGGSHEANPNDGVQLGVDNEGTPNLVEEGETVFDDYVYSARILADEQTKQMFRLPKKKDITFADISKKLERESAERPNDPISIAGLKAQMHDLADQQERQKQEMEAERAKAAFNALGPEEQTAVMQQVAQQEAMVEQQAMQQPSPEEAAIMQQQADGSQAMVGQEPPMMAEGGHLYAEGSKIRRGVYKALGFHTDKEFLDWARKHKLRGDDKWEMNEDALKNLAEDDEAWQVLISDPTFAEAVKDDPALVDAISRGYDFGVYKPLENNKATIKSISRGNWKATNGAGWLGSDDPAWLEATKDMSEDDIKKLSTEDVAKLIRATNSYKKGTEWLQNKDNALLYLNTLINDTDTPQVAKDYAAKFVKNGQWKDGFNYDYATVFGSSGKGVRETNPGTYWHTPVEAVRGAQAKNFVIGEDGKAEEIIGDVPTDWTSAGNYSWATPENDITYNYYKRPIATAEKPAAESTAQTQQEPEDSIKAEPKLRAEWPRYMGLFGPAVGLGMMAAGIGRPDYSSIDAAVSGAGNVHLADWKPIGDYLTYRPMDIWAEQNALNAQARATDRGILNSGLSQGAKMAGLLASGYNNQLTSGDLYRKALEYNDAKREKVAAFNRGTNQYNSEQYGQNSRFNAQALNQGNQFNKHMQMSAAREKMNGDAGWYNSLYGNVAGLFKGIGDIGTENFRMNRIGEMAARGDFGVATPDTYGFNGLLKNKAKGGKINRKKSKK